MTFSLLKHPNDSALAHVAAGDWLMELRGRPTNMGSRPYAVALSGGRIARKFFEEVARQSADDGAKLFAGVHFFWGDERCVPPSDPESNFALAKECLLSKLQVPDDRIHRLMGEEPEAAALQRAEQELRTVAASVAPAVPVFDLVFLGMGEDGHVASLFPGEPEALMASPAIFRAVTAVKPPPRRMTVGYGVIAAARDAWVLASGQGKEAALRESLSSGGRTPLARVLGMRSQTRIYTDVAV